MGVRIEMTPKGKRKPIDITPGWRSMAWGLLLEVDGYLTERDIPELERLKTEQRIERDGKRMGWSDEIAAMFDTIIAAIRKNGAVTIEGIQ